MSRLLVSGCSFTDYCWSTWADYLSPYFDRFFNAGIAGSDNATIGRSVVDYAEPNDTVVILWSGYDRWARYNENYTSTNVSKNVSKKFDTNWQFTGSVKSDKYFLVNYYHRLERFQATMDYINLVDCHSYKNQYKVYHFSAFPFFLGEIEKTTDPRIISIYEKYKISNNYLTEKSMFNFQIENNQCIVTKHEYNPAGDDHPTPLTHWQYAREIIAPKLNIDLGSTVPEVVQQEQDALVNNHHASKYSDN